MKIKGVIVRITPYKESGAMINLLSKDELLSFYAPHIYKSNQSNSLLTTPLMYGEFTFKEGKNNLLNFKEMTPIFDTRDYMNNYSTLISLNFINEVTLRLFNEEDMSSVYNYLIKTLELIKDSKLVPILLLSYLAVSLRLTGYGLNVDRCVISNSTHDIVGVSYLDGGLISRSCFNKDHHLLYNKEKINILRSIFKVNYKDLDKLSFNKKDVLEVLDDLLIYTYDQTGVKLKSANLIKVHL